MNKKEIFNYEDREIIFKSKKKNSPNGFKKFANSIGKDIDSKDTKIKEKEKPTNILNLTYKLLPNKDLKKEEEKRLKIFGKAFVENNYYKCFIIKNNKKYELREIFNDDDLPEEINNEIKIKLKILKNFTDMNRMFEDCSSLFSIDKNFSKLNTSKVTSFKRLFFGCSSLESLPDISNWNTI